MKFLSRVSKRENYASNKDAYPSSFRFTLLLTRRV